MVAQYNISPILNYSIVQTIKWLSAEFEKFTGKPLQSKAVTGPNALRQFSAELDKPDNTTGEASSSKLEYPYMLYTLGDVSLDGGRGGYNKKQLRNIVINTDIDKGTANMAELTPVKLAIGTSFQTSDFKDIVAFITMMMHNGPAVSFIMEAKDSTFRIGTKLNLPDSLSTPPVNYETPGEAYQFESLLVLDTYIGIEKTQRLIRNVVFSVNETNDTSIFFNGDVTGEVEKLVSRNISFKEYLGNRATLYGDKDVNS